MSYITVEEVGPDDPIFKNWKSKFFSLEDLKRFWATNMLGRNRNDVISIYPINGDPPIELGTSNIAKNDFIPWNLTEPTYPKFC